MAALIAGTLSLPAAPALAIGKNVLTYLGFGLSVTSFIMMHYDVDSDYEQIEYFLTDKNFSGHTNSFYGTKYKITQAGRGSGDIYYDGNYFAYSPWKNTTFGMTVYTHMFAYSNYSISSWNSLLKMRKEKRMTSKQYLKALVLGTSLLFIAGILFFPISEKQLSQNYISLIENRVEKSITVHQIEPTKGSIFFLVDTDENTTLIMHAEKFLFLNRYRLLNPITTSITQIETSNLLSDINISLINKSMTIKEEKAIIKHAWPLLMVYLVFPVIVFMQNYNKKKHYYKN